MSCFEECGEDMRIAKEHKKINKKIEQILRRDWKETRRELKLLLLGTGESGKSTFVKQMRIIHNHEYCDSERKTYIKYVFHNIVVSIQTIIKAMNALNIMYENEFNSKRADFLATVYVDYTSSYLTQLSDQLVMAIQEVWADPGVQRCYDRRNEYQLSDSAKYYFDSIERLSEIGRAHV